MKYFLYDILVHILVIVLLPYFLFKILWFRKYREGIPERFGFIKKEKLPRLAGKGPVVWVHAVSVGETKAALPVVKLLKERRPDLKVAFSTVTQTGNRTAEKEGAGLIDALFYFPMDLPCAVKSVINKIRPSLFVVVEKEVWPNVFRFLEAGGVPVIVANGTISERSHRRFVRLGFFFKDVFAKVSCFCARTREDLERAIDAGVSPSKASVTGNIKFDIKPPALKPEALASLKTAVGVKEDDPVIVAGSTHPGEEEMILAAFSVLKEEFPGLRLVIAPRHPERFNDVEGILKKTGADYSRRSKGGSGRVVLLDTLGELMNVYSFSTISIVGGSLVPGIGGHNLLEPAYFAKPVVYGGYLGAYLGMAEMLERAGGGFRAASGDSLVEITRGLLKNHSMRQSAGEKAKKVVEENRGASRRTVEIIERFLGR